HGFIQLDGVWYTSIARAGYGILPIGDVQTRWPFFPLLPGLLRGFHELGLPDRAVVVLLDQALLLLAFAGVYRLASRRGSQRAAGLAVWAIALFPASFVFSMLYPSAIFLTATVWAFVLAEEHHDIAAGALAAVATMSRPNG